MARRIIDFHSHLGDIFATQKNVIYKYNAEVKLNEGRRDPFVHLSMVQAWFIGSRTFPLLMGGVVTQAAFYRCWANTLEHLTKRLDDNAIDYVCLYPIYPHIAFEDYLAASKLETRILPFTSADWTQDADAICAKLLQDVQKGAKGLKIHPVLQPISLQDPKVKVVLNCWKETGLPVVSHCGANSYYNDEKYQATQVPEYGEPKYFVQAVKDNPEVNWVAAHAGGLMGGELEYLGSELEGYDRVWYDTTFRSADDVSTMLELFGEDRILFGTDTPFALTPESLAEVHKAVGEGSDCADKVLYRNAAALLQL